MGIPALDEMMAVLSTQSKVTIARWTIAYAQREIVPVWRSQHPDDGRPEQALDAAHEWLDGRIKS